MELELRFEFGKNWSKYLNSLTEEKVQEALVSLQKFLQIIDIENKTFIDVGSGSGLFSLAAKILGARVTSFDYDLDSVNCTKFLKEKYNIKNDWDICQGSILDDDFIKKRGQFDIVYSWGVLHHTGQMFHAFENVSTLVRSDGYLFISIYNDQGRASERWKWIKKTYNNSNFFIRSILILYTFIRFWGISILKDTLKGNPFKSWMNYGKNDRGMTAYHDLIDWVGGYPFEVAKPEDVFQYFKSKDFTLEKMKTYCGGISCNEYLFRKNK
ncbi:class I SAM-dependent methyltransferase [Fluviispira multicolorata]|uniref:Methyltransferase domain-containing protein n=1 Tax=Fluviispira multicolorata TaxID=2654512 RepID=A0A833N5K6_9BACT|nr:class I SAM-dependent methyltransferase [Fluviispira multicolorata]KAB8028046.1 methyltransferase domain-containing protein [Fluviispira multicolorata]